ncbi:MAG: hypothetical protein Q9178_000350 [Gyalolechia marmorata]
MKESIKQREGRLRKAVLGWQNMYNRAPSEALDARLKQAVAEFEAAKAERKASKPAGSSMTSRPIPEKASITAAAGLTQREHKVVKAQDNLAPRQAEANLGEGDEAELPEAFDDIESKAAEEEALELLKRNREQEKTARLLQQSIYARSGEQDDSEQDDSDPEPITQRPRRKRQKSVSPIEDEDSDIPRIPESHKKPRLENTGEDTSTSVAKGAGHDRGS